jgi:hypothetical protein
MLIQNPHDVIKWKSTHINVDMHRSWWYTSRDLGGSEITYVQMMLSGGNDGGFPERAIVNS